MLIKEQNAKRKSLTALNLNNGIALKEHSTFLESPRVKKLSFTVFESIQPISGSGGSTLA